MTNPAPPSGVFSRRFKQRYLESLRDYRFFYDDVTEIGNPDEARHVFYFVPGMNGTPGQMRFMLPSLTRVFGSRIYLKALHLPEFSAHAPTWEKYSLANVDRKIEQLQEDLHALMDRFERFVVVCSSNGFYDFSAAVQAFDAAEIESRAQVIWGACAPDEFGGSGWEKVFFPLNGFVHEGHRWWAYPNNNLLTMMNPEVCTSFTWRDGPSRLLRKIDLESRFQLGGLEWDYVSPSQLADAAKHAVAKIRRPWRAPAEALVAANDGYWQGTPHEKIEEHIRRYLPHAHCDFKPNSHLWVVNPSNATELFERLKPRLPALESSRSLRAGNSFGRNGDASKDRSGSNRIRGSAAPEFSNV